MATKFSDEFLDKHLQLCDDKYDPEKMIDHAVTRLRDRSRRVNTLVVLQNAVAQTLLGRVDALPNHQWGRRQIVSISGLVCYGLAVFDSLDQIRVIQNPSILVGGYFDRHEWIRVVNHLDPLQGGVLLRTVSIRYVEDFPALGSPVQKKTK